MKKEIEAIYLDMVNSIADINTGPEQPAFLAQTLPVVAKAMQALREFITANPFETAQEEISFFKHAKPRFYSWNIYLVEKHNLLRSKPHGTPQMHRKYFLSELRYLTRTRERHSSVFRYYHDDDTHRDEQYFLRARLEPLREGEEFSIPDPAFTTNMDYLFSKFRALDMLEDFVIEQVQLLETRPALNANTLRWTGDKVNLVELAYGLFYTSQLNNGKADIMDIIAWLRDTLAVPITREQAYRIYLDIRRRKVIPYTKFMDSMRDSLIHHIEESYR